MRLLIVESVDNLARVKSLIDLFEKTESDNIGSQEERTELLRAAVVFMHSSIEEVVRNLFVDRLPNAAIDTLNDLAYPGYGGLSRKQGVLLGDLLKNHGGRLVENVIFDAINFHVDRMNINNSEQLASQLKKVGVDIDPLQAIFPDLDRLMKRRHQIVHQMDRDDALDPNTRPISPIELPVVQQWLESASKFHAEIIRQTQLETTQSNTKRI